MKLLDNEKVANTKLIKGFRKYNSKINWLVFILISLVSLGGWIDAFGNKIYFIIKTETYF